MTQAESPAPADHGETTLVAGEGIPLAFRVMRAGLWVAGGSYLSLAFGFLINIALVHFSLLSKDDFGIFALSQFFFALLNLRPKTGINQAFVQRDKTTPVLVTTHLFLDVSVAALTLVLAAAVVLFLVLGTTVGHLLHVSPVGWSVVKCFLAFAVIGLSDGIMGTAWVLLDKMLQLGLSTIISSCAFILSYIPAVLLAVHHGGYWSLVVQNAVYSVLLLVGLWWTARRSITGLRDMRWRFDRRLARELLRFGRPVGLTTITGLLVSQLDNFFVGSLVGTAALGAYNRAYSFAQWPSRLVTNVISQTAFYTYARLQNDRERLQRTVTMSLWLITTMALPIALAIFVAAPDLVRQALNAGWSDTAVYLRFLVVYSVVGPLMSDAGWLFIAVGRPRLSAQVSLAQVTTLAVLGFILTLRFGVVGTCFAVGATFLVGAVMTYRYVLHLITLPLWSNLGVPFVASLATLALYTIGLHVLDPSAWPPIIALLAKMAFAATSYLAFMIILQPRETIRKGTYVIALLRRRAV